MADQNVPRYQHINVGDFVNFFLKSDLFIMEDCEESLVQHILNGGNLTLVIHVLDVTYFGITIFHSSSERQGLFVDFNRPGIAHYPTLLNKKRTRITVDNDLPVVKIEIRELNRSDGGIPIVRIDPKPNTQAWTESGSNLVLKCYVNSTTYPPDHELPMHITWFRNREKLETREQLYDLSNLTKLANGTVVSCEAREGNGSNSSKDDFIVLVHWGPDNVTFDPPSDYYKVPQGSSLPTVHGTADCYPPCTYTWRKKDKTISSNSTLSIGTASETTEGVYTFMASRREVSEKQTKSLTVSLKLDLQTENAHDKVTIIVLCVIALAVTVVMTVWNWKKIRGYLGRCSRSQEEMKENKDSPAKDSDPGFCTPSKENMKNEKVEKDDMPPVYKRLLFEVQTETQNRFQETSLANLQKVIHNS